MKEFNSQTLIFNDEFRNIFSSILFSINKSNSLNLIKQFDKEYSRLLELKESDIVFVEGKYSYVEHNDVINLSKDSILKQKNWQMELLTGYLHEKRHEIQYYSFLNGDDTILKDRLKLLSAFYMETPISKKRCYSNKGLSTISNMSPNEEDAYYNSNLELFKLIKLLVIYNEKQKIKMSFLQRRQLKKLASLCENTICYYDDYEYHYLTRRKYEVAIKEFYERYNQEKKYIDLIKQGIDNSQIDEKMMAITRYILEDDLFDDNQKENFKKLYNDDKVEKYLKDNNLENQEKEAIIDHIILGKNNKRIDK